MSIALSILAFLVLTIAIGFLRLTLLVATFVMAAYFVVVTFYFQLATTIVVIGVIFLALMILLNVHVLRRLIFTSLVFNLAKKSIPALSTTEEQALNAGTVGFEGDLFSGTATLKKLLALPSVQLSAEEQQFLDGPVEELCHMLNDYQISLDNKLSDEVWAFMKREGFFALIIPKTYGGKQFSAWAHSSIIMKVGSRSVTAAISIGVPNSLGPAELLLRYGTEKQKSHYLPRLAKGEEIPCFALTGPRAGSDAASIPDFGVVCFGEYERQKTLGIRLNWEKRYITLAPIATLIGLAFRLRDPDGLLSKEIDRGITCALIPRHLPGIDIGKRHDPLGVVFENGPITGTDVFIPIDFIIGGKEMIGQGWRMLMECLSAGRGITLPSSAATGASVSALTSGCYARIRHQFGLPIGRFEGVQEVLARIGTNAYLNLSALKFITASIDQGEQPPVASAIVKYHTTERFREAINDAMDIHAGKGICLGQRNYLSALYRNAPINITVEGANILTRNMIIFGQGAMRCHPYLRREMQAVRQHDFTSFDQTFFEHLGFLWQNFSRALVFGLFPINILFCRRDVVKKQFNKLVRYSTAFAFTADIVSITHGSALKRKESLSAKLGDVHSYLYLVSAILKRFHDDKRPSADLPLVRYLCENLFHSIEQRLHELYDNLKNPLMKIFYRTIFPWGLWQKRSKNRVAHEIADLMLSPNDTFDRMSEVLFMSRAPDNLLANLKDAFVKIVKAEDLEKRVRHAQKAKIIFGMTEEELVMDAKRKEIVNDDEEKELLEIARVRREIIAVDAS